MTQQHPRGRFITRRVFVSYLGVAAASAFMPALVGCDAVADTFGQPSNGTDTDAASSSSTQSVETPSGSFIARFAALSDIHVSSDFEPGIQHTRAAFGAVAWMDPLPDAIIINGDIVNHGHEEEYDLVVELAAEAGLSFPDDFELTMGDHEQWGYIADGAAPDYAGQREIFMRRCGQESMYHDAFVCGEHLIFLGPDADPSEWSLMNVSDEQLAWLDEQLAKDAAEGRRSFVFMHEPVNYTVPYTYEGEQKFASFERSGDFVNVVSKYGQAAIITGHTHSPSAFYQPDPNGPLYVADGAVAYLRDDAYTDAMSEAGAAQSRGMFIDVYDDRTEYISWDFVLEGEADTGHYTIVME